jgi:hypothetical protein
VHTRIRKRRPSIFGNRNEFLSFSLENASSEMRHAKFFRPKTMPPVSVARQNGNGLARFPILECA